MRARSSGGRWLVIAAWASGCAGGFAGRGRLDDAIAEYNQAARFGRADVAFEHVASDQRKSLAERHRAWGSTIQVLDVECTGVEKMSDAEAVVVVSYGWSRLGDSALRTTVVRQTWRNSGGPWALVAEERASGDRGLFSDVAQAPTH